MSAKELTKTNLVCIDDYEKYAYRALPPSALEYYKAGADQEETLRDNREAFRR